MHDIVLLAVSLRGYGKRMCAAVDYRGVGGVSLGHRAGFGQALRWAGPRDRARLVPSSAGAGVGTRVPYCIMRVRAEQEVSTGGAEPRESCGGVSPRKFMWLLYRSLTPRSP